MAKFKLFSFFLFAATFTFGQTITSPNGKIKLEVKLGADIRYTVSYSGVEVGKDNVLSITLGTGEVLGQNPKLIKSKKVSVYTEVKPVYGMAAVYPNTYSELSLLLKPKYSVVFRVYNDGVAYRFVTARAEKLIITSEQAEFNFNSTTKAWTQSGMGFKNWYEETHEYTDLSAIAKGRYAVLPVLIDAPVKVGILETDVIDYPAMLMEYNGRNGLRAAFAKVVAKDSLSGGNNFERIPYQFENHIASTNGTRSFPWRVMILAEEDKDLLYNNLTYLLSSETEIAETTWIKPGKVAWDWYNGNNLTGVDFKTGYNTNTYKYFIDFAARNGLEYIMMDEGWSDQMDLLKLNDGSVKTNDGLSLRADLDMAVILDYASKKGVRIFLWCVWHTLDKQMEQALDQFQKWGIAGVKVDFMSRDDQYVVNFYERLAREAAKRKMLVDFHGSFSPKGLERKYPNVINYEAVKGLEWNKFSDLCTPENVARIPFTRMLAGPMDFTPGGMYNASKRDFRISMQRPMTQGTRCQQLAFFTLFYAPLEMLSDSPTAYESEPEILKYISRMPTTWDETIPLAGVIGDYAAVARRKGTDWYVGAINDDTARSLRITFDFLEEGKTYKAELFTDGENADRIGNDYKLTRRTIVKGEQVEFKLASGGGFAITLVRN